MRELIQFRQLKNASGITGISLIGLSIAFFTLFLLNILPDFQIAVFFCIIGILLQLLSPGDGKARQLKSHVKDTFSFKQWDHFKNF